MKLWFSAYWQMNSWLKILNDVLCISCNEPHIGKHYFDYIIISTYFPISINNMRQDKLIWQKLSVATDLIITKLILLWNLYFIGYWTPRTSKQCPYFNRAKTEESKVKKIHEGDQMISIFIWNDYPTTTIVNYIQRKWWSYLNLNLNGSDDPI